MTKRRRRREKKKEKKEKEVSSGSSPAGTTAPAGTTTAPAGTTTAPAGTTTAPAGTTTAPAGKTTVEFGNYNYPSQIKTPTELKMGSKGTMKQLRYNIAGMVDYINVLVTGKTNAIKQNSPLGDSYFIDTNSKCLANGVPKPRHFYINNIPDGRLPFISGKTDMKMDEFRGLIPGIMEDISEMNPTDMLKSFGNTDLPSCSLKTFKVVDSNGNVYKETRYVADDEVKKEDFKEFNDPSVSCNPNSQKNKGNSCCITNENEKQLYSQEDEILNCVEGFSNKSNPYTHFKRKKLDKHLKMLILFILILVLILF